MRWIVVGLLSGLLSAQTAPEEIFKVYTESPRLLLRPQRLRLLKRESQRKSMRWEQFHALVAGAARLPEPGFAWGLDAIVTDGATSLKKAVEAALDDAAPAREVALVYDWCRTGLTPAQSKSLELKLTKTAQTPATGVSAVRDRTFAAIALGDSAPAVSEAALREVVTKWWRGGMAAALESGRATVPSAELYALYEMLHVIRDNLSIDLREDAVDYFKPLAASYLLGHYPASLPAPENEYRVPAFKGPGEPDATTAALSRAAGLSFVAYDNNSIDSQFLQGWLMIDHFLMRGAFGAVYEYLWANPYQPGLSYFHFPLFQHDARSGRLFVRSSWEDDCNWFGIIEGQMQFVSEGKITLMNPKLKQPPIELGPTRIIVGAAAAKFEVDTDEHGVAYITGLDPRTRYNIEVDDEEMWDAVADSAGTLELPLSAGMKAGVRVTPAK